jgi:electron transport complex protein RnfB
METAEKVYVELQKHLDKQAVGFPATKTGVEIRILKHLFTPEQAALALYLNYRPQSAKDVYEKAKDSGVSLEKVADMLEEMRNNGSISNTEKNGVEHYFTIPLLVGIAELHAHKATPEFWADFGTYSSGEFGRAYATTKVSQMRTIPVEKSISVEQHVTSYDKIREVINSTDGPITLGKCMCREGAKLRGQPCKTTKREETCMGFGDWARRAAKSGNANIITKEKALEITRQNEEDGLVLQPNNYQKIDFICACCGCCCGILVRHKMMPKPASNWAHNFHAAVDTDSCSGCGTCAERCQVNAIKIDEQSGYSVVNLDRCIGCGNCVTTCPTEALRLVKMEIEVAPPADSTGLYQILSER